MNPVSRLAPNTIEGQMVAILAVSFLLLLAVIIALEIADRDSPIEWAESSATLNRLERIKTVTENIPAEQRASVLESLSACHDGYTLTSHRYVPMNAGARSNALAATIARQLNIDPERVFAGNANLTRDDFSYGTCAESEIDLPMTAIVVSIELQSGQWLNTEIHPHELHLQELVGRVLRFAAAFLLIGAIAIFLIRRLGKPLNKLTHAAQQFADGLKISPVSESGPPDLRRAIQAFNAMQHQVADDVKKRTDALTAISHDLRTPLTALRIRGELVEDDEAREDLVASIDRMEKIIASALAFLSGESHSEPLRNIDLSAMLQSECSEFEESGQCAEFVGLNGIQYTCRSEALARAVRNLIENANKYGGGAIVDLRSRSDRVDIIVSDTGPGIPPDKISVALEPFRRLSSARESHNGGFGLGLAIVQATARGHSGELILAANDPSGLVATIRLPVQAR